MFGRLTLTLAAIGAGLPAIAQDTAGSGGMQLFITPYLWLSGINATTTSPLPREPDTNSS